MQRIIVVQVSFGQREVHDIECDENMGLNSLYEALNGQGRYSYLRDKIGYSLSVGDYLFIKGHWHRVASFGWDDASFSEVLNAL